MVKRPAFQHQGPDANCVIDDKALGWKSCTAYAMAMLIDAHSDHRPKGCTVRRRVRPKDTTGGLFLRQVAVVAEREFDVPIAVRTGANAIEVAVAAARVGSGRGFVLQGNNRAWDKGDVNHAVYIHEVRGGTPGRPREALLYDPQRPQARWMPWARIVAFGAELALNESGTRRLGRGLLYAGFAPRPPLPEPQRTAIAPAVVEDGLELRFGATRLRRRDRMAGDPPPGRRVNVRRTPRSLAARHVIDTLGPGEPFVAFQRLDDGAKPAGAGSRVWFGNRDGTEWVHASGLKGRGGPS